MSDAVLILLVLVASGIVVWALSVFVAQGYRRAVLEPSKCPKCGGRRRGQFCSRCGHKKF
jgi:hypothetical protein